MIFGFNWSSNSLAICDSSIANNFEQNQLCKRLVTIVQTPYNEHGQCIGYLQAFG